jgi:hypothetical protein
MDIIAVLLIEINSVQINSKQRSDTKQILININPITTESGGLQ